MPPAPNLYQPDPAADELFLDDVLRSALAGRPISRNAILSCVPDSWKPAAGAAGAAASKAQAVAAQDALVK